jgi:ABC-type lipoprotein release transport system permease subunit
MGAARIMRRRAVGMLAMALIIGVAGGAVLAAFAGARRTSTAATRLAARGNTEDIEIDPANYPAMDNIAKIAALPEVKRVSAVSGAPLCTRPCAPNGFTPGSLPISILGSPDGGFGYRMDLLGHLPHFHGRMADPTSVNEVEMNPEAAQQLHASLGSIVHMAVIQFGAGNGPPTLTPIDLKLVGIVRTPDELINSQNETMAQLFGTPAFARRFASHSMFGIIEVQLRHHAADIPAFEASLRRAFPGQAFDGQPFQQQASLYKAAVRPYSDALQLFGVIAALAAFLVVGEALWRAVRTDAGDNSTLRALGATHSQRGAVAFGRAVVATIAGAALAVLIGWLLSPLFPLGIARPVEPDPGLRFDLPVALIGFFGVVVPLMVVAAVAAWVTSRAHRNTRHAADHTPFLVDGMARAGAPVSAVTGLRLAFRGDRSGAGASSFATLFGLVVAIATTGAALTFGANLNRFVRTPTRYGWTWDARIQSTNSAFSQQEVREMRSDHDIHAVTTGTDGVITLKGRPVSTYGLTPLVGNAMPTATSGRMPNAPNEVALGEQTLHDLHLSVGDSVIATTPTGASVPLRIVGRTLLPSLTRNSEISVADGAVVTAPTLLRLDPSVASQSGPGPEVDFVLANVTPGSLPRVAARYANDAAVSGASQPGDIRGYDRVSATPLVLAALLALLGIAVLAHLLITSVRAHRNDLAILKSLGFTRGQISASVAWQATALAALALIVGIPLGVIAGRWSWSMFPRSFGAIAPPVVAPLTFTVLALVVLALANLIAAIPARLAARTRAAALLTVE